MKVLVAGGRDFSDAASLRSRLNRIHQGRFITTIIHGDCDGADKIADEWARENKVPVERFPARWVNEDKRLDKSAGPKRGVAMLARLGEGDVVLGTVGGKGTSNLVGFAAQMISNGTGRFELKLIRCKIDRSFISHKREQHEHVRQSHARLKVSKPGRSSQRRAS